MTLKTVLNKVIVEPVEAETVTKGGIIIPDTAQEKPQKGTVIATGKGKADEPMEVKAGDTVLFGKYSGAGRSLQNRNCRWSPFWRFPQDRKSVV